MSNGNMITGSEAFKKPFDQVAKVAKTLDLHQLTIH